MPAGTKVFSPAANLRRQAVTKGFLGGNKRWMVIGVLVWVPPLLRKAFGRSVEIVSLETLKPGQAVRIEAIRPPSKAERRAARRVR